jgi:hypothetical protein
MSKYEKWYASITENAKNRNLQTYTETHHVIPRSLGGTDEVNNLVKLTAREHFICHWLLTKTTTGEDRYKMLNALRMMRAEKHGQERYKTKITARVYESIKEEYAQLQSVKFTGKGNGFYGKKHTEEAKERIRQKNLGSTLTPEQRAKISAKQTGKKRAPFSAEWKANLIAAHTGEGNGMYGKKHSDEAKAKQSAKAKARVQPAELKERISASLLSKNMKRDKKLCPHCNQEVAVNGYGRWHGERCKQNPVNS